MQVRVVGDRQLLSAAAMLHSVSVWSWLNLTDRQARLIHPMLRGACLRWSARATRTARTLPAALPSQRRHLQPAHPTTQHYCIDVSMSQSVTIPILILFEFLLSLLAGHIWVTKVQTHETCGLHTVRVTQWRTLTATKKTA